LEDFGNEVLEEIKLKQPFKKGEIAIYSILFIPKITPVTGKPTDEPNDITVKVIKEDGRTLKYLEVKVVGNTLCPHSLEIANGKTHIQRAEITLGILTDLNADLPLEKMIEICENSLSAPTYGVLKSEDEKFLIEKMYSNPRFIEDVVRECFSRVKKLGIKGKIKIKGVSYESIHKHNAVSEIERNVK